VTSFKYVSLPFLWSVLPSVSVHELNDSLLVSNTTASANKQYFSETIAPSHIKRSFKQILVLPKFRWNQPHIPSFIEMQERSAKQTPDTSTGFLQNIITYQANDSIAFDITNTTAYMHGVGTIKLEKSQITAEDIAFNWHTHTLIATGKKIEEGKINPKSVFQDGEKKYIADELRYNIKSMRGKGRKLFTKIDDALIRANQAKMDVENTYYADTVDFTTCNLARPHYTIKIKELKFVMGKRMASGPFQFYFDWVPTPLGFFYGLLYLPTPKMSGIIRPNIGEKADRGFFIKDGGFYFYFNDYIDLALRGSIYSKGDSNFQATSTYIKRYGFKGQLSYQRDITATSSDLALVKNKKKDWQFKWTHETTNSKISSLSAEVDIRSKSPQISVFTSEYTSEKLKAETKSKVRYTRRLVGTPYSMNASIGHDRDFSTKTTKVILPQFSLSASPIYLFRNGKRASQHWYEDIYIKHTSEFQNELSNQVAGKDKTKEEPIKFSWKNRKKILEDGRYGVKHTVPIETNIKLFTYLNFKPSFKYVECWYLKRRDYKHASDNKKPEFDLSTGFYRIPDYAVSAELQTTLYGTHLWGEEAIVQGVRHRIEPSVSITYTPGISKDSEKYFQKVKTAQGEQSYDRFEGAIYGMPNQKERAVLTLKIDNVLEIKAKNASSKPGKSKKIPLLESLSVSTGYDLLEDSFPLEKIQIGARTRLLDNLISIEYNADFDPYCYRNKQRIPEYAWQHGEGIGTLTKSSLKLGTTLKSKEKDQNTRSSNRTEEAFSDSDLSDVVKPKETAAAVGNATEYVDFNLPWQLKLGYLRTYEVKPTDKSGNPKITQQVTMDADFKITQNWKIGFQSTYDLDKKELMGEQTKIHIYRDLHCWQMNIDWKPLAKLHSYEFSIGLKAEQLKDFKLPHERSYKNL
jgi:hypothetical protein